MTVSIRVGSKGKARMEHVQSSVIGLDPVWDRLCKEAHEAVENEFEEPADGKV